LTTNPALNHASVRQKYPRPRRTIHATPAARNAKWITHFVSPFEN